MYPREIFLFDNLVEAQLSEHEPPKLAGWTRFPIGSYRRLKCGTFGLSRLMLSVDTWMQGASKGHGRYRPLVAIQKKCKSEYNETERFFYFTGCTIIPGFLTFNLARHVFYQVISETRVMHKLKYDVIGLGGSILALSSTLVSQENFEGDIHYNEI